MGVPGLFAWLRRKYPQIIDESAKTTGSNSGEGDDRVCHNLYIGRSPVASLSVARLQDRDSR